MTMAKAHLCEIIMPTFTRKALGYTTGQAGFHLTGFNWQGEWMNVGAGPAKRCDIRPHLA